MIDATATLNGVTIGAGTSYRWAAWPDGILNTPNVRSQDTYLPFDHGSVAADDYLSDRLIVFDVWVLASSRATAEAALTTLATAFVRSSTDIPLAIRISGTPSEYYLMGRPRGIVTALDRTLNGGTLRARCSFLATDPRKYATALSSQSASLSTATGGLSFAALAPFVFGTSGTPSSMSCVNNGNITTPFIATFYGPLTAPQLTCVEQSTSLYLASATLAAGDVLVVDSAMKTVTLQGAGSRYSWLASTSKWFSLLPGTNTLTLTGASGAGNVSVTWRSAWV